MNASLKERGLARLLRWGGALLARAGHTGLAALLFRAADGISPVDLPLFAYARALWLDRQYEGSKLALTSILARLPEHPEANNLLGVLCFEEHKMELAGQHFRRAIKARPDFAAPRNNLGNIHLADQEFEEAARNYRAALTCDAQYVEALTNLGVALNLQGDSAAAEGYCRRAVELAPEFAGAHCNLGNVLLSLERRGEALAAYREALRLQPDLPEALVNLALILEDSSYLIGTIDYYEKVLQRQPGNHLPHVRIAQALQAFNRWDDARQRLGRALELRPEAADAWYLLAVNYTHVGDVRAAADCLGRLLARGPNALALAGSAFDSLYLEDCTGEQLCAAYRDWAECYATRPLQPVPPVETVDPERRLRIGYVSRDYAQHSVAYFLEPILTHHDRALVEVFCYSTLIKGDSFTDRFRAIADGWRDISTLSLAKVVELVREDGIDILVDLSGHTTGNRLDVFACKPAPVQVSYLGHPTTTGIPAIDYRLGDAVTDPVDLTGAHYVERLWQLPGCFLTYQPQIDAPQVLPPPLLSKGHITFGSFNNVAKINDRVVAVWAEVLMAVPSSRLLLKGFAFNSSHGRARVSDGFLRHGVSLDRIELVDWRGDTKNHLELYGDIDIALDPFPYNGTTTSCEALWMGVPVICLEGDRHSARVGASLLTAVGLSELLARDNGEYIRIAVELAADPLRLVTLREGMRDRVRASVLLDHAGFTDRLERAFREMWRSYCQSRASSDECPRGDGESAVSLDIAGVATISLPDSLDVMTRFVVEERGDWFEDEIRFVRKLLQPDSFVVDVGANYGVYTLSMAACVGHSGKVFAFEPSPSTARWLRNSVTLNGFSQVEVVERAVSDFEGHGTFRVDGHAELSRLVEAANPGNRDIGVGITTLDVCRGDLRWGKVDFIKIDAEGQEPNVVRGGRRLLDSDSPLVMAEYRHGHELNHAVLDEFSNLGFHAYRLVPGLLLLAPVHDVAQVDPYLLNLFFCRDDTAEALAARGMLVRDVDRNVAVGGGVCPEWSEYVSAFPCARKAAAESRDAGIGDTEISEGYALALGLYASAYHEDICPGERLAALTGSLAAAENAASETPTLARRLTLARVRADYGLRDEARSLFAEILEYLQLNGGTLFSEPFLAPSKRFEFAECRGKLRDWLIAAVAEWLASNTGFSSFFTAEESLRYLQLARRAGYGEGDVQRRINLILRRKRLKSVRKS